MLYLFGDLELDEEAGELRRAGKRIALQPRVLATLQYLVRNAGRVVSRDELIEMLWDGQQLNEGAVPWSVSHARRALGQSGRDPRPIETVRGKGYRFAGDVRTVGPASPARASARPSALPPSSVEPPLVGRGPVMAQLQAALDAARAGRGGLCLLSGEAGIGKSRCASELLQLARQQKLGVLVGRSLGSADAPALWPFAQAVRALLEASEPTSALHTEASALLDELTRVHEPRDDFWSIERLLRLLLSAARERTQVLVLEDLQRADARALRALRALGPELPQARMLVVLTVRDPDDAASESALDAISELRPSQRIALSALTVAEVSEYLEHALGQAPSAELARAVRRKTGGNPGFLAEVSALLGRELHAGHTLEPSAVKLPEVARRQLYERVEQLEPGARSVLEVASVLGDPLAFGMLLDATELGSEELLARLDVLLDRGLLVAAASENTFAFAQPLLCDVLYEQLPVSKRVELHARIVRGLEASLGTTAPSLLAHHARKAAPALGQTRALLLCGKAGDLALHAHAYEEATALYDQVLADIEHTALRDEAIGEREIATFCLRRARALLALGRISQARASSERALERASAAGHWDVVVSATGLLRAGVLVPPTPEPKLVAALLHALEALPKDALADRARVLARLSLLPPHAATLEQSDETSRAAVLLARDTRDDNALQEALCSRLYPLSGPDRIDELLELSGELLRLETRDGSFFSAQGHLARYQAFALRGDPLQAEIELEAYGKIAERLQLPAARWEYDRLCAQRLLLSGELERAERRFGELRAEGERMGLLGADAYHMAQRYALELERGDVRALLERATLVAANDAWRMARPQAGFRSVAMLRSIDCGDPAEAKRELSALMMDACSNVPMDARYLGTLVRLSIGAIELRDREAAEMLYRKLAPYAGFNALAGSELWFGSVAYYLAVLARFLERPARAEEHAEEAVRTNERIGYRTQAVRSLLLLSRLLRDSGNPAKRKRAAELAAQAMTEAQALGLPTLTDRAARLQ